MRRSGEARPRTRESLSGSCGKEAKSFEFETIAIRSTMVFVYERIINVPCSRLFVYVAILRSKDPSGIDEASIILRCKERKLIGGLSSFIYQSHSPIGGKYGSTSPRIMAGATLGPALPINWELGTLLPHKAGIEGGRERVGSSDHPTKVMIIDS